MLSNSRIGPALIDDVRVIYQGRERQIDPYDFYLELRPDALKTGIGVEEGMTVEQLFENVKAGRVACSEVAVVVTGTTPGASSLLGP